MKQLIKLLVILSPFIGSAQVVPGIEENIPYLVNFGPDSKKSFGDDDFKQAFYFVIPTSYNKPFYIRIFDPEIGGLHDEGIEEYNTKCKFSFYGGPSIYTKALGVNAPEISESHMGDLLEEKEFGSDEELDNKWYSFGPFNPKEGEFVADFDGYLFKMLAEGISGDDGNCYKYFLSNKSEENAAISGTNTFTFEYTVRLHEEDDEVSHLYPYVDNKVLKLKQHNFDLDAGFEMRIFSTKKIGELAAVSGNDLWSSSTHVVYDQERGSCMDFQIINKKHVTAKFSNTVMYATNQYGEFLPFMSVPIGDFTPKKKISIVSE